MRFPLSPDSSDGLRRRAVRRAAATASAILCAGLLGACGTSDDEAPGEGLLADIESGKVVVGSSFANPGLSIRDADGGVSGLDVDVATYVVNAIAEDNGWDHPAIEWRDTPTGQRAQLLRHGYVDMVASTYSINDERSNDVSFGGPYLLTHQALLVRSGDYSISGLESLDGHTLCFVTGTTAADTIREELPGVALEEYDNYDGCLNALRGGYVDALSTDAAILSGFSTLEPGVFRLVPLEAYGEPLSEEHYGIGLAKGDDKGVEAVNAALDKMYSDGSFDTFVEKNLASDAFAMRDTPGDLSFLQQSD